MQFTVGIRFGNSYWRAANATWPFTKLTIEPDTLILSTLFFGTFHFEKAQIKRLSQYSGFIPFVSTAIRIEHAAPDYPPFMLFWTFSPESVKADLIQNGYDFT